MHKGDRLIYYSPKVKFGGNEPLHAFTALGEIADDRIYQVEMAPDFKPFRRDVRYEKSGEIPIQPLIPDLDFIRNKKAWGSAFRFGLLEIGKEDFERIAGQFTTSVPVEG